MRGGGISKGAPRFAARNMNDLLLSVWTDVKSFLTENLNWAIIAVCAAVAAAAAVVVVVCAVKISRIRRQERSGARLESVPGGDLSAAREVREEAEERISPQNAAYPAPEAPETEQPQAVLSAEDVPAEVAAQPAEGRITFVKPRPGMLIRYRYNRSFTAKLIQSEDKVKRWYSELKKALLSYKKVTPRTSWRHESFRFGRPTAAKFVIRGKTLCLCLALDPAAYAESKYIIDDMSRYSKFAATPLLYRIKNDRRCRYAKELVAALFADAEGAVPPQEDFSDIPYEDTQSLVERDLVRIVSYREVAAEEGGAAEEYEDDDDFAGEDFEDEEDDELEEVSAADAGSLMADDRAKLRVQQGEALSDRSKAAVVNVDTLDKFFAEGEKVTLGEIKRRVPFVANNVTYVKVLARGTLTKPLVVVADDFSLEAVKMIVLTGGRAIKNRK